MPASQADAFDPSRRWRLSAEVSLRDEAFGALAYNHRTRRLVFLKSPELVGLVRRLEEFERTDAALAALVPAVERCRYLAALASLRHAEVLSEC